MQQQGGPMGRGRGRLAARLNMLRQQRQGGGMMGQGGGMMGGGWMRDLVMDQGEGVMGPGGGGRLRQRLAMLRQMRAARDASGEGRLGQAGPGLGRRRAGGLRAGWQDLAGQTPGSEREQLERRAARLEQLLELTYERLKAIEAAEQGPAELTADPFAEAAKQSSEGIPDDDAQTQTKE